MFGVGLCGVSRTGLVTLLAVFHLSIASRKDFSEFATALFFPRSSAVPEMTTHRGCAAAIVHGVLQ